MCGIHHHLVMVVVEMMIFAERGTMEWIEVGMGSERKAENWWKLKREKETELENEEKSKYFPRRRGLSTSGRFFEGFEREMEL